jgi:putative oxidoreductase
MLLKSFAKYRENVPLILRTLLGLTLVFSHGLPKVMAPDRWEREGQAMANLGITFAPVFWGFMAGATELVCGVLFLIGLLVRPSAVMILFIMFVAALNNVVNAGGLSGLSGGRSHPIDFAAGTIALLILGAGAMSLDRKLGLDK